MVANSKPCPSFPIMTPEQVYGLTLLEMEQMVKWAHSGYRRSKLPYRFNKHLVSIAAEYAVEKYRRGSSIRLTRAEEAALVRGA